MFFKTILIKIFSRSIIFLFQFSKLIGLNIRINELETRAIGHYSKSIEMYILENQNKKNKYIDIWFRNKKIANRFLYNKWKKYLNVFPPFFVHIYNCLINEKKLEFLIPYRHWRQYDNWVVDVNQTLHKNKPLIQFTEKEEENAKNILNKFKIKLNKNFFCFANRDSKYRFHKHISEDIRNFSIHDYNYLLNKVVDTKTSAVRLGKHHFEKISLENKNIYDYPYLDIEDDSLEFYLMSKCNFFISGDSGINYYSTLFRKPLLMINVGPYVLRDWSNENCELAIFKKFYSKKLKRNLNYLESEEVFYDYNNLPNIFKKLDLEVINNTPKEIFDLTNEFTLRKNKEWTIKDDEIEIQDTIQNFSKKMFSQNFEKINLGYEFAKQNIELFK